MKTAEITQVFRALPSPSIVLAVDVPKFSVVEVNDAYAGLVGRHRGELLGRGFFEVFDNIPFTKTQLWNSLLEKVVATGEKTLTPVFKWPVPTGENGQLVERYFLITNTPVFDEDDARVSYIIRSVEDVTDAAESTSDIFDNERFLCETQRIARVGGWEADLLTDRVVWTDVAREIYEAEPDFTPDIGSVLDFFIPGPDRETFVNAIQETIAKGSVFDLELEIITARGNVRWIRITGKAFLNNGICTRIYGAIQDIDQQKNTERQLCQSSKQFESLVQTIDGIVWEVDARSRRFLFVSEQIRNMLGVEPSQVLGDPDYWRTMMHADDRESAPLRCQHILQEGQNHAFEYRIYRSDGEMIWVRDLVTVIRENGEVVLLRGFTSDITETKRLEVIERLEREVLEMTSRQDSPMQDVLDKYLKGIEAVFPQMKCSVLGVKNRQLYNWSSPSLPEAYIRSIERIEIGPETGSCGTAAFLGEQVIVSDIEIDRRWRDYRHLALRFGLKACWSHPVKLSDGSVVATFAVYYDKIKTPNQDEIQIIEKAVSISKVIFENKRNSEFVRDYSLLLSQGQELARFGTWQWEIETNTVTWSDNLYSIYGLTKAGYTPTFENYISLIHPTDRERVRNGLHNALMDKGEVEFEERVLHSTGEERYLRTWTKCVVDESGKVAKMIGACLDVTDSRKIARELQVSESRLRSLVDAQTNYVVRTDLVGNYTYYNNKFEEDFAWFYNGNSFLGVNCLMAVQPYSRMSVIETVGKCLKNLGTVVAIELDHIKPDNKVRSVYWHFIALSGANGAATEIQCIGIDISERKTMTDALRKSNERYELLNKATNDAIYDWDLVGDHIHWGEGFTRLFGFETGKSRYPLEKWLHQIHPDDRERVSNELHTQLADRTKVKWSGEYQFRRANDTFAYVEEIGYIRRNRLGQPVRMIGVLRDITRQKKEEYELKLLSSVITNTNDAVMIAASDYPNPAGLRILYVNSAFTRITGYAASEVLGRNPLMLKGFGLVGNDFTGLRDAITNIGELKVETLRYKRGSEEIFINVSLHPVSNERGQFTHWISIGRDVTEKRRYVHEIEERNKKLEEIAWMQSHVLRAPLARVLGLIDLLRNYPNSEEEKLEFLERMAMSAHELDTIIRDISAKTTKAEN